SRRGAGTGESDLVAVERPGTGETGRLGVRSTADFLHLCRYRVARPDFIDVAEADRGNDEIALASHFEEASVIRWVRRSIESAGRRRDVILRTVQVVIVREVLTRVPAGRLRRAHLHRHGSQRGAGQSVQAQVTRRGRVDARRISLAAEHQNVAAGAEPDDWRIVVSASEIDRRLVVAVAAGVRVIVQLWVFPW